MAFRLGPDAGDEARKVSVLASAGMAFAFSVIIGIVGGVFLDRWLGTSPWLLFAGLVLGFGAGVRNLIRASNVASRR
jgi:ATP synthase protein I